MCILCACCRLATFFRVSFCVDYICMRDFEEGVVRVFCRFLSCAGQEGGRPAREWVTEEG